MSSHRVFLTTLWLSSVLLAQNVLTNPTASQSIVQPAGTVLDVNNLENTIYVDQFNWSVAPGGMYTHNVSATLTFTAPVTCPLGLSGGDTLTTNKLPHWIRISGGTGTAEVALITGGTCTAGGSSGTITFTPAFDHTGAFVVSSATSGAQEAEGYVRYLKGLLTGQAVIYSTFEIVLPQGVVTHFYAPLYLSAGVTAPWIDSYEIWRSGFIECDFFANCIQIGDTWQLELLNGTSANQIGAYGNKFVYVGIGPGLGRWTVTPSSPSTITAGSSSATLTITTGPSGFFAAQPGQFLWLNGTSAGLEGTYHGTGEEVLVTGGTCANGGTNCTIIIKPADPWITTLSLHDSGYTLSSDVNSSFEDNGQGTLFESTGPALPLSGDYLGHYYQIDNDQSAVIRNHSITAAYLLNSTSEFQGSVLYSPGDFSHYAGIATVENSNLSMQCTGNAVEWYSGNDLRLTDVTIQAFSTFGSKVSMVRGGFGVSSYHAVYSELGSCTNPILSLANAAPDTILVGATMERTGSDQPANAVPIFAGNQAGENYQVYYIVFVDGSGNKSVPVPIGYTLNNDPSRGGKNVTVKWHTGSNKTTPVVSYDVLRVTGTTGGVATSAPIGTGNWGVAFGGSTVLATSCNIDGLCTFTDNISAASSYTVPIVNGPGNGNPNFGPVLSHWSTGGLVASSTGNLAGNAFTGQATAATYNGPATCAITPMLAQQAIVTFSDFARYGESSGQWPCLSSGRGIQYVYDTLPAPGGANGGTFLPDQSALAGSINGADLTGKLNFGTNRNNTPHDIITLVDSNIDLTEAINVIGGGLQFRRAPTANDIGFGVDGFNYSSSSMRIHAGNAIDFYVGLPSGTECGTNCFERLTASLKTFKVPLSLGSTVTQYNGLTTGGTGLAPNLGTPFNSGGLTANEPAQTVYTTAASGAGSLGNYRVCITLWPTVTGTATAIQANAIAPSGSGTVTLPLGPALSLASLSKGGGACGALHVVASSAIQCSTTGYSGSGTYQMSCTVEQLQ